jgi:hypothetical protein
MAQRWRHSRFKQWSLGNRRLALNLTLKGRAFGAQGLRLLLSRPPTAVDGEASFAQLRR